jgi:hypothetical protein
MPYFSPIQVQFGSVHKCIHKKSNHFACSFGTMEMEFCKSKKVPDYYIVNLINSVTFIRIFKILPLRALKGQVK